MEIGRRRFNENEDATVLGRAPKGRSAEALNLIHLPHRKGQSCNRLKYLHVHRRFPTMRTEATSLFSYGVYVDGC